MNTHQWGRYLQLELITQISAEATFIFHLSPAEAGELQGGNHAYIG
jgi:hypothetical protein